VLALIHPVETRLRRAHSLALLGLVGFLTLSRTAVAWPQRDPPDAARVAAIRARSPHAAELLEQGETRAAAGDFEPALRFFLEAKAEDPLGAGFLGRRECEVLTSLNRRAEAQAACWRAMQEERSQPVIAAAVRALVSGPTAPSFDELYQALLLLTVERGKAQVPEPRLVAAMCDVAESIGDGIMLQHCTNELERIAPADYPPTRRAQAALEAPCPPWRFWLGWFTVTAALVFTAWDSLRRRLRRDASQGSSTGSTAAAAVFAAILAFAGHARADLPPAPPGAMLSDWAIDDKDPEGHVPTQAQLNADPLQAGYWIQDLILKAQVASKHGDHEAAVKYYRAMYKAVPDKAGALRYLCNEYDTLGQIDNAVNACGQALMLNGLTVNDYVHFLRLILGKPGMLSPKEVLAATNVIAHLKSEDAGRDIGNELECELGVRTSDRKQLRECTTALGATAPNDPKTIGYEWALAMLEGDIGGARRFLTEAGKAGVSEEKIKIMQQAVTTATGRQNRAFGLTAAGLLILLGAISYGLVAKVRRRAVAVPTG
jgi:tetratricopeptide (TPR) repeat protein